MAVTERKKKRGFMDCYDRPDRQYDPKVEGYGSPDEWRAVFNHKMGLPEAEKRLRSMCPFAILGILTTATNQEIKKAYRKLALKWHPDRNPDNPGAEGKFKEATAAWTVLKECRGIK